MLTLNYFWFYVIAFTFASSLTRYGRSNLEGNNPWLKMAAQLIGPICDIALFIFVVIGFWQMPHWWIPIVCFVVGIIAQSLLALVGNIVNLIILVLGTIGAPLFTILAYLGLFSII